MKKVPNKDCEMIDKLESGPRDKCDCDVKLEIMDKSLNARQELENTNYLQFNKQNNIRPGLFSKNYQFIFLEIESNTQFKNKTLPAYNNNNNKNFANRKKV